MLAPAPLATDVRFGKDGDAVVGSMLLQGIEVRQPIENRKASQAAYKEIPVGVNSVGLGGTSGKGLAKGFHRQNGKAQLQYYSTVDRFF